MSEQAEYRIALGIGLTLMLLVGAAYRIRSQRTKEALDRSQEGWFILIGLRLSAAIALAVMLAFLFAPNTLAWSSLALPGAARWFGFGLAAVSGCLKVWTFQTLGANLTDTVVTREQHTLVTHGPYRWVRHPFYTSFAMDVAGVSWLIDSWLLLALGTFAFVLIVIRTRREEANLLKRFGGPYREYRKAVGAFLPKLRLKRT